MRKILKCEHGKIRDNQRKNKRKEKREMINNELIVNQETCNITK